MARTTLTDLNLPAEPIIVGHRGACGEAPENTLPSVLLAVQQGAHMVEVDLHLTADGELVASHDRNLMRTAGIAVDVEATRYTELRYINVANHFKGSRAVTMPRLADLLAIIPLTLPVNLELKREIADVERYIDVLERNLTRDRILVSSFRWDVLRAVRRRFPELPLAPLADGNAAHLPGVARELNATSAHCNYETITPTLVEALQKIETPALVFTVNDTAIAETMFAFGVAGVFTNHPGTFIRHFANSGAS